MNENFSVGKQKEVSQTEVPVEENSVNKCTRRYKHLEDKYL